MGKELIDTRLSILKRVLLSITIAICLLAIVLAGCSTNANDLATGKVTLSVASDTWSETSTPVVYRLTSEDADVDFTHALTYENNGEAIELAPGEYTVETIAPIDADGTTYNSVETTNFTVEPGTKTEHNTELVKMETPVNDELLDSYLSTFEACAELGDDSFNDELVSSVKDNINNIKTELAEKAAAEAKAAEEAAAAEAAAKASTSTSTGNSGSSAKASSGSSAPKSNSGSSAPKSSGGSAPAQSAPAPAPSTNSSSGPSSNSGGHVHEWTTTTVRGETVTDCWCGAVKGGFY